MTSSRFGLESIVIGPSPRMRAVFEYVARIGPGSATVLITGESGTGKEMLANAIHAHSTRRHQPFVPVSCALFSDSLIESELFGHERGAFTGAVSSRPGRFERAKGGTIFLDDIDDVPLAMQVKLLRALQNRTIERLGGVEATSIDVRVVAGTKRDLRKMVKAGTFREDLYYRLNVLPIDLPPLRERREDIPALAEHFLRRSCAALGVPWAPLSPGALQAFLTYDWPGNVRELENACERAAQNCTCGQVGVGCVAASVLLNGVVDTPRSEKPPVAAVPPGLAATPPTTPPVPPEADTFDLDGHLRRIESDLIQWALDKSGGNKSRAASLLGVKRSTLGDRIAKARERDDREINAGVRQPAPGVPDHCAHPVS